MARAAPRADIYLSMSRLLEDISEKESRHQPAASQIAKWLGLLGSLCRARFNRMNSFGARPVERVMTAGTNREIDESYASLVRERADALLVSGDGFFNSRRVQLAMLAVRYAVPATYSVRDYTEAGRLISYGTNFADTFRQMGNYSGRVLKGTRAFPLAKAAARSNCQTTTRAELSTIATRELAPYSEKGKTRVRIDGPQVLLEPNAAQTIAVILHELATNTAKYGALSTAAGQVELKWSREANGRLHLCWTEIGGPAVEEPTRHGFGGRIIEQMIAQLDEKRVSTGAPRVSSAKSPYKRRSAKPRQAQEGVIIALERQIGVGLCYGVAQ